MHSLETTLCVENIRVKAHHGWYDAERKVGGMYAIHVKVYDTVSEKGDFSDLEFSLNYEKIYNIVIEVMAREFKLIEDCCKTMYDELRILKPNVVWEVLLVKENPPLKYVGATSFKIKG